MKKPLIIVTFLFLLFSLVVVPNILARSHQNSKVVILEKGKTINKDYFAAGERVLVLGTVNGDVYAAGKSVLVDGVVNGDIMAAGGKVNIKGRVRNDIRAAGGTVTIAANVGGNSTLAGENVTIAQSARVSGSIVAGAGTLDVSGPIGRGATIGAGSVTFDNRVNGDVLAGIGNLTLTQNANINGDLTYWSDEKAQIIKGATVSGRINHQLPPKRGEDVKQTAKNVFTGILSVFRVMDFVSSLIIGLLLLRFMPAYTKRTVAVIEDKPWQSFFVGLAAIILAPIAGVILLVTIIGIPIAILILITLWSFAYLAKIFAAIFIGEKVLGLMNQRLKSGWVFFAGLLLYMLVTWLPVIGFLFTLVILCIGIGAMLIEEKNLYLALRSKKLI